MASSRCSASVLFSALANAFPSSWVCPAPGSVRRFRFQVAARDIVLEKAPRLQLLGVDQIVQRVADIFTPALLDHMRELRRAGPESSGSFWAPVTKERSFNVPVAFCAPRQYCSGGAPPAGASVPPPRRSWSAGRPCNAPRVFGGLDNGRTVSRTFSAVFRHFTARRKRSIVPA